MIFIKFELSYTSAEIEENMVLKHESIPFHTPPAYSDSKGSECNTVLMVVIVHRFGLSSGIYF